MFYTTFFWIGFVIYLVIQSIAIGFWIYDGRISGKLCVMSIMMSAMFVVVLGNIAWQEEPQNFISDCAEGDSK